jgi:hypothetical protein
VPADPTRIRVQRAVVLIDIGIPAGDGDGSRQRALGGEGEPVAARALETLVKPRRRTASIAPATSW